ncbi:Uncharacterized protein FWK35_00005273 [Aphis craccivora]|uniref:Uncharacterized protein n=1 Tax=Aphis craccivora TaxID=307492 RepID=A0A6G0YIS4_APHCR|nr:Uncharacterized protein FWK35_00005273 [Aphis craccivora]
MVLKYSLKWLDDWEARAGADVTDNQFLTKSTSEGLRVTLNSCIELIDYLIDKFRFKYVYLQYIQMESGANDNPTTPTFLQVYKLLSEYSIIKPPKYGNCSINIMDPGSNLIRLSDIKTLENLKNKLDTLIDDGTREFTDIIEHGYAHAQTQCVTCEQAFVTHLPPTNNVSAVEDCFMKNIKSSDVYNKTVDDLILHVLNTNMRYLPMQLSIT